jgi:hypothetical protein
VVTDWFVAVVFGGNDVVDVRTTVVCARMIVSADDDVFAARAWDVDATAAVPAGDAAAVVRPGDVDVRILRSQRRSQGGWR